MEERPVSRADPGGLDGVLDPDGHAVQQAERLSATAPGVESIGIPEGPVGGHGDEGPERGVQALDARQGCKGDLASRHLTGSHPRSGIDKARQRVHPRLLDLAWRSRTASGGSVNRSSDQSATTIESDRPEVVKRSPHPIERRSMVGRPCREGTTRCGASRSGRQDVRHRRLELRPPARLDEGRSQGGRREAFLPAHRVGREREYCHIEKLANLDQLPKPHGFRVAVFTIKIAG